jgi:DnaK suppressor protein
MNLEQYKHRLLDIEKKLAARTDRLVADGAKEFLDSAHDLGDASVADEAASETFTEAEADSTVLSQVRDALTRISDGTYGKCIVDGGPIEKKRLDALPWTPYCLKHERQREGNLKTPTL